VVNYTHEMNQTELKLDQLYALLLVYLYIVIL